MGCGDTEWVYNSNSDLGMLLPFWGLPNSFLEVSWGFSHPLGGNSKMSTATCLPLPTKCNSEDLPMLTHLQVIFG